jgi:rhodanese-related sulfurtransferase
MLTEEHSDWVTPEEPMEMGHTDEARTLSTTELSARLQEGPVFLLDVREYPEYAEGHVEGARCVPLGDLRRDPSLAGEGGEVLLICRSGRRARDAANCLRDTGRFQPVVVDGGLDAWRQAGYPICKEKGPISLERQVRIAAGSLILTGLLAPGLGFLPYVVGAGLIVAGVTNSCALGMLLARLPWNRPRRPAALGTR